MNIQEFRNQGYKIVATRLAHITGEVEIDRGMESVDDIDFSRIMIEDMDIANDSEEREQFTIIDNIGTEIATFETHNAIEKVKEYIENMKSELSTYDKWERLSLSLKNKLFKDIDEMIERINNLFSNYTDLYVESYKVYNKEELKNSREYRVDIKFSDMEEEWSETVYSVHYIIDRLNEIYVTRVSYDFTKTDDLKLEF